MKLTVLYIVLLSAMVQGCTKGPKLPDMRETYSYQQTKPFGTSVMHRMVRSGFGYIDYELTKTPFHQTYLRNDDSSSVYISVSKNLFLTAHDAQSMLGYVADGNTLIISSSNIDSLLLSAVDCSQSKRLPLLDLDYQTTSVSLVKELDISGKPYSFYYYPFSSYFTAIRNYDSKVLGYNTAGQPDFVVIFHGNGKLVLHCNPATFSNYFLLTGDNYQYLQKVLQLAGDSPSKIYWDDYYRSLADRRDNKSFSTLSEIMKHPALALAFFTGLLLLILYVIFQGKRKRNIIPVQEANENTSVAFTETIARLYMQQADNKSIAEKMITYFYDHVRTHYFINVHGKPEEFIDSLSRKSGISLDSTRQLYFLIKEVHDSDEITDEMLLRLNKHIREFYKIKS